MKVANFLLLMMLAVFFTSLGTNLWAGVGCLFAICTVGAMMDLLQE